MALLKLTDDSFTPQGFNTPVPIGVDVDLATLSAALSTQTGRSLSFDSLDVTAVTLGDLIATGLGSSSPEGEIIVGDFLLFSTIPDFAVSGFGSIVFTNASLVETFPWFSISNNSVLNGNEDILTFDSFTTEFDFSLTGLAPLEINFNKSQTNVASLDTYADHILIANDGDNDVYGYFEIDSSFYGSNTYLLLDGDDLFVGGDDQVSVEGGNGNDLLLSEPSLFNQTDGFRDDHLLGGAGNDTLFGGAGIDTLNGGSGDDWLYASQTVDSLSGGTDRDRFLFSEYLLVPSAFAGGLSQVSGQDDLLFLGEDISTEFQPNIIADFTKSADLIALVTDDVVVGGSGSEPAFFLYADVEQQNLKYLEVSSTFFAPGYAYLDGTNPSVGGESGIDNLLIMAKQTISSTQFDQILSAQAFEDDFGRDASFEIIYTRSDLSPVTNPDVFRGVSLSHNAGVGVVTGGQDKFDLSGLALAGSGITLDVLEFDPQTESLPSFTASSISATIPGFFSQAVHIEYRPDPSADTPEPLADLMVYLDIDNDGNLDSTTDMAFELRDVRLTPGGSPIPSDISVADLAGIFIFQESQRNAWFSNVSLEEPSQVSPGAFSPTGAALDISDSEGTVDTGSIPGRTLPPSTTAPQVPLQELTELTELYIAYFDRAPDASGLAFWTEQAVGGLSLEQISAYFYDQPETRLRFPEGDSDTEFLAAVYDSVLGRAPDEVGQAFWAQALASGAVTRDQFVLEVLRGARAETGNPADAAYLEAKTALGLYFAVDQGLDNGNWGVEVMQRFDGSEDSLQAALQLTDAFAALLDTAANTDDPVKLAGIPLDSQDALLG